MVWCGVAVEDIRIDGYGYELCNSNSRSRAKSEVTTDQSKLETELIPNVATVINSAFL